MNRKKTRLMISFILSILSVFVVFPMITQIYLNVDLSLETSTITQPKNVTRPIDSIRKDAVDYANAMVLIYDTTLSEGTTVRLPLGSGTDLVNVEVDWGDATPIETFVTNEAKQHTYAVEGIYTVSMSGQLDHFGNALNAYVPDIQFDNLVEVVSFGQLGINSLLYAFCNATNLVSLPDAIPASVTNLSHLLYGASRLNDDIGMWNTSHVTDMSYLFYQASLFNQSIGNWDTSNVTTMDYLFYEATAFNQPIGNWNMSQVTSMVNMFGSAVSFNQSINTIPIGDGFDYPRWDVSSVVNMTELLKDAVAFNQYIGDWNTSNVIAMRGMFAGAIAFNQPINTQQIGNGFSYRRWDILNVTSLEAIFWGAVSFNQPIGDWNTSNVIGAGGMFADAISFNQDINTKPIGDGFDYIRWETSKFNYMGYMFYNALSFNQDIGDWNTSMSSGFDNIFNGAIIFDQDISQWDFSKTHSLDDFLNNGSLSKEHYNALLNRLSAQAKESQWENFVFNGGLSKYSEGGVESHDSLINELAWTIIDGGFEEDPTDGYWWFLLLLLIPIGYLVYHFVYESKKELVSSQLSHPITEPDQSASTNPIHSIVADQNNNMMVNNSIPEDKPSIGVVIDSESETESPKRYQRYTLAKKIAAADSETIDRFNIILQAFQNDGRFLVKVLKYEVSIRGSGKKRAILTLTQNSIKLHLALKPEKYGIERFHQKDYSEKRKYADYPMTLYISSTRSIRLAISLFDDLL